MHVTQENRSGTSGGWVALAIAGVLLAVGATGSAGVSAEFWRVGSFGEAIEGRLDGTSVLHDGRIVLSGEIENLAAPDVQYVWSACETPRGIVIATGTPGRVFRLEAGKWVELFATETADVPAIAVTPDGVIYVGTAPGGEVYRIGADGESELFFETGEGYVWSMDYSPEVGLVVGTGDTSAVYVVDADGDGTMVFAPDDMSVSAVAVCGGRVLAGTSMEGLLLDVTPGRDVRVLYDSSFEEISGIALDGDGRLCFSATTVSMGDVMDPGDMYGVGFGEGAVYRVSSGGSVVELWRSRTAPVTSLSWSPTGALLAGIGTGGLVYAISGDGLASLAAGLDCEEVLSLRGSDPVLAATGGPGGVFRLGAGFGRSGEYESDVRDALSVATWGELSWDAGTPSGSKVSMHVRSGNTSSPDATWSEWTQVTGERSGPIACPPARYLQWRASLVRGSGAVTPEVRSVEAAYVRENRAPIVTSLVVHDSGDVVAGSAGGNDVSTASQTLPNGVNVSYSLDVSAPKERGLPLLMRGVRTASWEAVDPNGDALTFDLYLRADDEEEWKLIEEGIRRRTIHTWDTSAMTDGTYRLKVTASDRDSNPAGSALTGSEVSQPFVVDHTPPSISDLSVTRSGGGVVVKGSADDSGGPVLFVDVSVDYGQWTPAFAGDGIFDSGSETFELVIDKIGQGEHAVAVRAVDRHGNPVVARRVIR